LRSTAIVRAILTAALACGLLVVGGINASATQTYESHKSVAHGSGGDQEHRKASNHSHEGGGEDRERETEHEREDGAENSRAPKPTPTVNARPEPTAVPTPTPNPVATPIAHRTPTPVPAQQASGVVAKPLAPAAPVAVPRVMASVPPAAAAEPVAVASGLAVVGVATPAPSSGGGSFRAIGPRDPLQPAQPGELVVPQTSIPVALVASLGTLPLLFAIWFLALLRIGGAIRREQAGRAHLALAAELGIAPIRLAGLNAEELTLLQDKVAFDELTGVMRRAGGLATLDREIARARRQGAPLSVAFVDVDGLKKVNDTLGHAAGDRLLRELVEVLSGRLRADDAVFRYGGDEFCCVLPNANLEAAARIIEDALLAALARGVTFSFGVAQLQNGEDRTPLLARADSELLKGRAERGYPERQ
jgi:diguanylate cyclase (GGDEF)-like protein